MTRTSRYLMNTAAVAAVLVLALVVGYQLQQRQQVAATPSSSPSASASAPVATPSQNTGPATATPSGAPSSAPSSVYNDDFGFIVFSQASQGAAIRTESGSAVPGTMAASPAAFAVSPDGKLTAYWTSSTSPAQLRMFTTLGNATEQTLVTLAAGQRGGGVAWASDSTALLFSTESGTLLGGGQSAATLESFELAGGRRALLDAQNNTGWVYRPVAWDRSASLAAAGLTGEGGYMGFYLTVRTDQSAASVKRVDTSAATISMGSVHASSDGKLVLGVGGQGSAGQQAKYWPTADYAANKVASGTGQFGAQWQPGSHKIGLMAGDGFVLFNADDGSVTPARTVKSGMYVRTFRADGTAVVLGMPKGGGSDVTEHTMIRISDGASVIFEVTGSLMASVRLR